MSVKKSEPINAKAQRKNIVPNPYLRLVLGIIFGNIIGFIFLVILRYPLSYNWYTIFAISSLFASVTGGIAVKENKKLGITAGVLSAVILLVLAVIELNTALKGTSIYVNLFIICIISLVGGFVGSSLSIRIKRFPIIFLILIILIILIIILFGSMPTLTAN